MGGANISEREPRTIEQQVNYDVVLESRQPFDFLQGKSLELRSLPTVFQPFERRDQAINYSRLVGRMNYLRDHWEDEGLKANWTDFDGIGFLMDHQISYFYSGKWKDLPDEERIERSVKTTEYSVRGWVREYLKQALLFPGLLEIKEGLRLVDMRHGAEMDLEETISKLERGGSVWEANIKIAKPFLLYTSDNSMVVIQSPKGASGIPDNNGEIIDYTEAHHIIMLKRENKVYTYTIKSDFDDNENREFVKRLFELSGQSGFDLTKNSQVEDYVLSVTKFDSKTMEITGVRDIIDVMRQVRYDLLPEDKKYRADFVYKNKGWEEIYEDLEKDFEELWHHDSFADRLIDEWGSYSRFENWSEEDLRLSLATSLLDLSQYILDPIEIQYDESGGRYIEDHRNLGAIFGELQTIAGCAGGGRKKAEEAASESIFGDQKTLDCLCPFCKKKTKAIIANGKITCTNEDCGRSAPYKCL